MARRALGVVCACAAAGLVWTALPQLEIGLHTRPGDGVVDWLGARAWRAHVNIYAPEGLKAYGLSAYGFAHPPTAPFWLLPYTHLDVDELGTMMGYTTVALLAVHVLAMVLALGLPLPLAALAFGLVLHSSWFHNDLLMAQVSEPIAFFYLLAWLALRRGRDLLAGLAIGLACTFKPFAGVLWLMLLSLRRWGAAAVAGAAWLAVAGLMTARFGLVSWVQWNGFNKQTAIVWLGHLRNATLPGVVLRLVQPACQRNGPPRLGASIVATLLGLAILAACHLRARRAGPVEPRDPRRLDLVFAAWTVASVFVNPVAWEHYAFVLLVPIAVFVAYALDATTPRPRAIAALAFAATVSALLAIDMHWKVAARAQYFTTRQGHLRLHVLEVANWLPWAIALVAALVLARWYERAPTARR